MLWRAAKRSVLQGECIYSYDFICQNEELEKKLRRIEKKKKKRTKGEGMNEP